MDFNNNDNNYDPFLEDDDIDLLDLISADTNSTTQYLVFEGSNNEIYAINVSKVRELLVFKDLQLASNNQKDSIIRSTADIRGDMTTIINFDEWFGNNVLEDKDYELIILAGFGGHNLGIMIKSVEYIVNINPSDMQDNSQNNPKTNFIARIKLNGQDRLCTIFDCDKLLLDTFDDSNKNSEVNHIECDTSFTHDKCILFADDSKFIRKMVESLLNKLNIKAKIFENGLDLLDELKQLEPEQIGLIITDLEMPVMDGNSLIKNIIALNKYNDIDIIIHTNMSNDIMESSLLELGATEVIGKIDMLKLSEGIKKYFR